MSASNKSTSSVLYQRKKTTVTQSSKRWLQEKDIKDPDAVEWEPPKLAEDVNLGKIISSGEWSIQPVWSE